MGAFRGAVWIAAKRADVVASPVCFPACAFWREGFSKSRRSFKAPAAEVLALVSTYPPRTTTVTGLSKEFKSVTEAVVPLEDCPSPTQAKGRLEWGTLTPTSKLRFWRTRLRIVHPQTQISPLRALRSGRYDKPKWRCFHAEDEFSAERAVQILTRMDSTGSAPTNATVPLGIWWCTVWQTDKGGDGLCQA
jgi:hypothetical protein